MRKNISKATRLAVRKRANHCCEYCKVHEEDMYLAYEIDHIISIKHGGGNELSNLAYACPICNQHKGTDLSTFVDMYSNIVPLFHPRIHHWEEHFSIDFGEIIPLSDIGKGTIKLLQMNDVDLIILRRVLAASGRYPRT
jgi:hypothetical protein